jgi:hypothetical protein
MFAAFLLLSAGAEEASPPTLAVAPPEVAAERVKACGFRHVRVKDDDELQEQVVEVTGVSTVPEGKMRCAVKVSLDTVRYVLFPLPASKVYWRLYTKMEDKRGAALTGWMQGEARDWLQQHGLLGRLPTYQKGKTDDLAFARQLEGLCGPKAAGAFQRFRGHVVLILPSGDFDTAECLISAASASGLPFGFVGNEYQPNESRIGDSEPR